MNPPLRIFCLRTRVRGYQRYDNNFCHIAEVISTLLVPTSRVCHLKDLMVPPFGWQIMHKKTMRKKGCQYQRLNIKGLHVRLEQESCCPYQTEISTERAGR